MRGGSPFYTIEHSTRSVPELADLLREAGADFVVDVRTVPRSRANPQFNADALPEALAAHRIGYRHVRQLGGLRGRPKGGAPSRNAFWENQSFRNYADYAATPEFREGMGSCAASAAPTPAPSCAPRRCGGAATGASSPIT